MQSKYVTWYGHDHLAPLISISKVLSWSLSSPARYHDLHHLDLYQCVITWLSHQLLPLQLLLLYSDKVKQLFGTCLLCKKETTIGLLPVAGNFNKTWSSQLIQQLISHHVLTISHHSKPCKNKLDVLYFVVASFMWLLRASSKNHSYLRIKTTMIFHQVCCFNIQQGPPIVKLDSTKVGETDTRQAHVCKAHR